MTAALTVRRWRADLRPLDPPLDREASRAVGFRSYSPLHWTFGWTEGGRCRRLELGMFGYRPPRRPRERSGEWAWKVLWSLGLEDAPAVPRDRGDVDRRLRAGDRRLGKLLAGARALRDRVEAAELRALREENAQLRATVRDLRRRLRNRTRPRVPARSRRPR